MEESPCRRRGKGRVPPPGEKNYNGIDNALNGKSRATPFECEPDESHLTRAIEKIVHLRTKGASIYKRDFFLIQVNIIASRPKEKDQNSSIKNLISLTVYVYIKKKNVIGRRGGVSRRVKKKNIKITPRRIVGRVFSANGIFTALLLSQSDGKI